MKIHPLAELIPPMGDEDYAALRGSIREKGQQLPIILFEDQILDGRHRQKVCDELAIQPKYELYEGDDPAGYVISLNLERRHLTTGQRAAAALALLDYERDRAKERQGRRSDLDEPSDQVTGKLSESRHDHEATAIAGEKFGVSGSSVKRAQRIAQDRPDLHEEVKAGKITVSRAYEETTGRSIKTGRPLDADAPVDFEIHSERHRQIAEKNKLRMEKAVGTAAGITSGFPYLKVAEATALATDEEIRGWIGVFDEATRSIRQLKRQLEDIR